MKKRIEQICAVILAVALVGAQNVWAMNVAPERLAQHIAEASAAKAAESTEPSPAPVADAATGTPSSKISAFEVAPPTEEELSAREGQGLSKDESVFVLLDSSGGVKKQIVSSWLHNDNGLRGIADLSDLNDIQNIKGDTQPRREGGRLYWDTDDHDVYYQGLTDKQLPVSIGIRYFLDGKELSADEIAGKTGEVEIRVKVVNNYTEEQVVDGGSRPVAPLFLTAVLLNLPDDTFTNVKADDGMLMNESTNQMVVFATVPGLVDSFDGLFTDELKDLRDKLTDEFSVTAHAENFHLPSIMAAAANDSELFDQDSSLESDLDDLLDGVHDLGEATDDIFDGTTQLADAGEEFDDSMGELRDSYAELHKGVGDAREGAAELRKGAEQAAEKITSLTAMVKPFLTDPQNLQGLALAGSSLKELKGLFPLLGGLEGDPSVQSMIAAKKAAYAKVSELGMEPTEENVKAMFLNIMVESYTDSIMELLAQLQGGPTTDAFQVEKKPLEPAAPVPVVPEEPVDPENPVQPVEPDVPAEPEEPATPSEGETPIEPTQPETEQQPADTTVSEPSAPQEQAAGSGGESAAPSPKAQEPTAKQVSFGKAGAGVLPLAGLGRSGQQVLRVSVLSAEVTGEDVPAHPEAVENPEKTESDKPGEEPAQEAAPQPENQEGQGEAPDSKPAENGGKEETGEAEGEKQPETDQQPDPNATQEESPIVTAPEGNTLPERAVMDSQGEIIRAKVAYAVRENFGAQFELMYTLVGMLDDVKEPAGNLGTALAILEREQNKPLLNELEKMLAAAAQDPQGFATGLDGKLKTLTDGVGALADGADELENGMDKLYRGSRQVRSAIAEFKDATEELRDKTKELTDGVDEFKTDGINELTDKVTDVTDDGKTTIHVLDAISDASDGFTTYTGAPEGADTSVKFVMKTDEIKAPEVETPVEEAPVEEEKNSFWEKFKALFTKGSKSSDSSEEPESSSSLEFAGSADET